MKALNRRQRQVRGRGQAMVELALGLTVFVTVLVFAIHFAEVGFLSVKVTEAAHSAIFDATAPKLHEWPGDTSPADTAARNAGSQAQSRYRDFDSRTTSSMNPTGVFTRGSNMKVECKLGEGPDYTRDLAVAAGGAFKDNGGINCQATASIDDYGAMRIPQRFMDQGGGRWFSKQHYVPRRINVCAIGRGSGGSCGGKLTMMLDDWGLAGTQESKQCRLNVDSPLGSCENEAFFKSARNTYLPTMLYGGHNGAASRFAWQIVGVAPILPMGESAFFMSDRGEPGGYTQTLTTEGERSFSTTPGGTGTENYKVARDARKDCFLGMKCPTR